MTSDVASPLAADGVAVLMAVHAGVPPEHFREALASIRQQTIRQVRLHLWCDGPLADGHEAAIAELARPADVVLRSPRGIGLPGALNRLIDAALADPSMSFLARMDADDISLPTRFERQIEFLHAQPRIAIAGTWVIEFVTAGVELFRKQLPVSAEEARRFMIYRSPLAHPTVMFRRAVFEAGHRYDPTLRQAQDYELWSRLLLAGFEIANVPEYLLWYRMAGDFYARRTGLRRAATELKERWRYARRSKLMRPHHLLGLASLFLIRIAPVPVKRLAYRVLR
jgi:glycosyltransferase involved in cell wall biosynthesis